MDKTNQKYLLVGKVTADGTPSIADGVAFNFDNLATGEIVAVNAKTGLVETDLSTATNFKLIQKCSDGRQIVSPILNYGKYDYVNSVKYLASTQKVVHIGYDGVTATRTFPYGDNEIYNVGIELKSGLKSDFANPSRLKASYTTKSSVTTPIAATKSIVASLATQALDKDIKVEFMCVGASVAITGAPTNFTFTKGSKVVTWTGTDPTNIAAGEHLRLGAAASTDEAVYEIASVSASTNSLVLAVPYQGSTETLLTAVVSVIDAATALGVTGIKITGTDDTAYKRNQRELQATSFDVKVTGSGFIGEAVDIVIESTSLVRSRGDGRTVADLETRTRAAFSDGMNINDYDPTKDDQKNDAVLTERYDMINVACYEDSTGSFSTKDISKYVVDIAVPTMDYAVTIPATITNAETYTITVDGTAYSYLAASTSGTALADGLIAAMGGSVQFVKSTSGLILYIQGTTVTVNTDTTIDMAVAANTSVVYPSWGSTVMVK